MLRVWLALVGVVVLTSCGGDSAATPSTVDDGSDTATAPAEPTAQPAATAAPLAAQPVTQRYGDLGSQFGELWVPDSDGPHPVVVLVHGGFWRDQFGLNLMDPLAADLVARGHAVWNIEYRRVGTDGGGWPTTLDDVAAAVDHLAVVDSPTPLDLDRIAIVGHSAGGHLALWAASRTLLAPDSPWSEPLVVPVLAVGQAPVANLALAAQEGAGGSAVEDFLGGSPTDVPDRYEAATPLDAAEADLVIVQGTADTIVIERWATVGPRTTEALVLVPDADHFDVINPAHPAWEVVIEAIDRSLRPA